MAARTFLFVPDTWRYILLQGFSIFAAAGSIRLNYLQPNCLFHIHSAKVGLCQIRISRVRTTPLDW